MSRLALLNATLGGTLIGAGLFLILAPAAARQALDRFPRSRVAGWVLATLALLWAARLLFVMPMGGFDRFKPALYGLTPLAILALGFCMDDLLAVRALGGLLLMLPALFLDAGFGHPSVWRVLNSTLAYLMVIKGLVLVLEPYRFRQAVAWALKRPPAARGWGGAACFLGAVVLTLALTVY